MRPIAASTLASLAVLAVLAGCASPAPAGGKPVAVSAVLNQLKDELNAFASSARGAVPNTGACYDGAQPMDLVPIAATVTLKAAAQSTSEASVGLSAPLGVLSIDPSLAASSSNKRTQTIVVPLAVPKTSTRQAVADGPHALADALSSFRDEILRVDHSKTPCLRQLSDGGPPFAVSLAFDVVRTATGGLSLTLLAFKIGDKQGLGSETQQTLEVQLALVPDGAMLARQPQ